MAPGLSLPATTVPSRSGTSLPAPERVTITGHTQGVSACAVSPDGTWIVSTSSDHTLKIWDVATGIEVVTLTGHTNVVTGCAVSPDGTWIVSCSHDQTLKIWDVASGTEKATLTGHTDKVTGCAVSSDGTWIVSCSFDQTLRIWDIATGSERATLTGRSGVVMVVCGESGRYLDRLIQRRQYAAGMGFRHRHRKGHPHWPYPLG